jgi:hypothetical protein
MSALNDAELIRHKDNFVSLLNRYNIKFYFPTAGVAVVSSILSLTKVNVLVSYTIESKMWFYLY